MDDRCSPVWHRVLKGNSLGTAPAADYALIRTENVDTEYPVEEDNWVVGAELADSLGCDVLNTSLGYTEFDDSTMDHTYADLDGRTLRISIAAGIASRKGMVPVNSAGNSGSSRVALHRRSGGCDRYSHGRCRGRCGATRALQFLRSECRWPCETRCMRHGLEHDRPAARGGQCGSGAMAPPSHRRCWLVWSLVCGNCIRPVTRRRSWKPCAAALPSSGHRTSPTAMVSRLRACQ